MAAGGLLNPFGPGPDNGSPLGGPRGEEPPWIRPRWGAPGAAERGRVRRVVGAVLKGCARGWRWPVFCRNYVKYIAIRSVGEEEENEGKEALLSQNCSILFNLAKKRRAALLWHNFVADWFPQDVLGLLGAQPRVARRAVPCACVPLGSCLPPAWRTLSGLATSALGNVPALPDSWRLAVWG